MYQRQFKRKRGRNTQLGQAEWNGVTRMVGNLARSRAPNSHSGSIGNVARRIVRTFDNSVAAIVTQTPAYNNDDKTKFIVELAGLNAGLWVGDGASIEISKTFGYEGYDSAAKDIRNWSPWYEPDSIVNIKKQWIEEINSKTAVGYTHTTKTFALGDIGLDVEVGDMALVSGENITSGQYVVSEVPDNDSLVFAGMVSTADNSDSAIKVGGGMFWVLDMPMRYCGSEENASIRYNEEEGYEQAVWA